MYGIILVVPKKSRQRYYIIRKLTVEVELFALKNVCDFSNPANMKFCERKLFAIFILFESL